MRPLTSRISVIYLYVKDFQRATAFYRDVLGLALEGDEDWVETDLNGVRFALHQWHEGVPEPGPSPINVNFEVADIDAAAERLRAAGSDVGEVFREPYGAFCTFRDPEGNTLDLFQPPS